MSGRFSTRFSAALCQRPAARLLAAFAAPVAVAIVCAWAALPSAMRLPSGNDDVNWAKRSLSPWWFPEERRLPENWPAEYESHFLDQKWPDAFTRDYFYCIDHPSVGRIVYRQVLHAAGVYSISQETWDSTQKTALNIAEGRLLPDRTRNILRATNFTLFLGGVMLAYIGFLGILRTPFLAALTALPLALEPTAMKTELCIIPYIGADAALFFMLAALWLAWQRLGRPRPASVVALGAMAGMVAATKLSGAFVVLGLAGYFAVYSTGRARVLYPIAVSGVAAAVFLALNPVFLGPGPSWTVTSLGHMLHARLVVNDWIVARPGTFTRIETIYSVFPHILFILPAAGVLAGCARERWFRVTLFFSVPIIAFNVIGVPTMFPRYATPIREAFLILFMPCGMVAVNDLWRRVKAGLAPAGATARVLACPAAAGAEGLR